MGKSTVWTVVGVVVAVVIAWFLVNAIFQVVWFIARLGMVAIVALIVFLVLRMLFARRDADD
ncbi:hypothetical protein [Microbacterium ulmi]|uniref:Flagellar biosynthesis protein FlhA n=1 Tax=Microbacterium ulmi TaxID=179095 RepID=A0A7Y2M2T2_9MICO|nr:hypothetical protein [Microbacterium ulmi]NII68836.1 uncharacterized protein YacL [Microbacterium ulmi]NNH04734.1 hypothetical protein [Microbacterium ulmi]